MVNGNLFWQTRRLTQLREDHLTYFLASALECDAAFREGYQELVLGGLAAAGAAPRIARVEAQAAFAEQKCRPDLLLILDDGRQIACEHKLDAPETPFTLDTGEVEPQLKRYLKLDIAGSHTFGRTWRRFRKRSLRIVVISSRPRNRTLFGATCTNPSGVASTS